MTKLSSFEFVTDITPHPNADLLEMAHVGGYTCIVGKGDFAVNDIVVLIQPDTVLPDKPWAEGFKKRSSRVKAMKLRGAWSFGIVMHPYTVIEDTSKLIDAFKNKSVGTDISHLIGVTKYEAPVPQCLDALGPLPVGLGKTDEERWQNIVSDLPYNELMDVTLKIDGQSGTFYTKKNSQTGEWEDAVCSRSLCIKPETVNNYTRAGAKYNINEKLHAYCVKHNVSLALRGEIYGSGIQAFPTNPHSKGPLDFAAFSIFNMDTHKYENPQSEHYYEKVCAALDIPVVPMVERQVPLTFALIDKYSIEMNHINGQRFEGVVMKHNGGSFKIINLDYDTRK